MRCEAYGGWMGGADINPIENLLDHLNVVVRAMDPHSRNLAQLTTAPELKSQPPQYPLPVSKVAAVVEWYRYRTVACFVTGSSPVPLKTRRVGQRCTLNLSRAETSSRWCGVVVRRGGASSGVVHVT
ncbi:uncharacterized protein TNCV_2470101 [Trichonephila clavipes]|nr:uncharacterized protein TNCV_2470101 [Trichonephila clavipes]